MSDSLKSQTSKKNKIALAYTLDNLKICKVAVPLETRKLLGMKRFSSITLRLCQALRESFDLEKCSPSAPEPGQFGSCPET